MKVVLQRADTGYRNDWLWLPKKYLANAQGIRNSLTYGKAVGETVLAYSDEGEHLVVPREYIPFSQWSSLPFTILDTEKTDFPRVDGVEVTSTLRDDIQRDSLAAMLLCGSGIISLACGRGKTVVAIHALVETKTPGLIVVHTKDLEEQWRAQLLNHTNLRPEDIGTIRGKVCDWEKPVCIASLQTLVSLVSRDELPEELREHFGVVIYDEVHNMGASGFSTVASLGKGIRWGLSATTNRRDGCEMLYQYHIGKVIYENLLQDNDMETWFVRTGITLDASAYSQVRDRFGEIHIALLMNYLSEHPERNDLICSWLNTLLREDRTILVLSSRVEQLKTLYAQYENSEGLSVGIIHGAIKAGERKKILDNCKLIFATVSLAKEGLDRKEIDSVVLALPMTNPGALKQIRGRAQRTLEGKQKPVFIVLEDEKIKLINKMCDSIRYVLTTDRQVFHISKAEPK